MSDEPKISEHYRSLAREEPPRHLDEAILAASRRAVDTRPAPLVVPTGRRRWYFPLAAAAIIMLAVSVTLQIEREQPDLKYATEAQPAQQAAGERETIAAQPAEPQAAPAEKPAAGAAAESPREMRDSSQQKRERRDTARVQGSPVPQAAPSPAPAPQQAPAPAVPPTADVYREERPVPSPPAVAAVPKPEPQTTIRAAPAPQAAPSPPAAKPAPPAPESRYAVPSVRGLEAERRSEPVQTRGRAEARLAEERARAEAAQPSLAIESLAGAIANRVVARPLAAGSPEQWLLGIDDLKRQGKHDEAAAQLALFRQRYPDYRIPQAITEKFETR